MFAATFNEFQNAQIIEKTNNAALRVEISQQDHDRLVREWTETLSNMPGYRGRQPRRALGSGPINFLVFPPGL